MLLSPGWPGLPPSVLDPPVKRAVKRTETPTRSSSDHDVLLARLRPALPRSPGALSELTPRETEVLRLVAEGLSNGEIADRLVVSDETVKTHVSRILGKLAVRDRTQAVVVAYESGLVTPRARDAVL